MIFAAAHIAPAQEKPAEPPLRIKLDAERLALKHTGAETFETAVPVTITIETAQPRWEILCKAEDAKGPEERVIPAETIFAVHGNGSQVSVENFKKVAEGGAGRKKVAIKFRASPGPLWSWPPGTYEGTLEFKLSPLEGQSRWRRTVPYRIEVGPFVSITTSPGAMEFGGVTPGLHGTKEPVRLKVVTNVRHLKVDVSIGELTHGEGKSKVPVSNLTLAMATYPRTARLNAGHRRFGENAFNWTCQPGRNEIYMFGRIKIGMNMAPGSYQGLIHVDYQIPESFN